MCDSDFPVRDCSVCGSGKLYVEESMALTIGLRGMFGLCTFGLLVRIVLVQENL